MVGDFLGQSYGRATEFLGISVGFSGFSMGAGFFLLLSGFLWIFSLLCSGGSGVLSHGADFGLGCHG